MKPIIEVDHVIGGHGVKGWEQLEGLLEDAIALRSRSVSGRVGPEPAHMFVSGDNVVEACKDVIGGEACIPAGLEVCGRDPFVLVMKAVVLGMRKGQDIKPAHLHLSSVMFMIHVMG